MSTISDIKVALGVTNRTQRLFYDQEEYTIVTPEQSKYIKPVDIATASLILEGDLHVNTSLKKTPCNEQSRTVKQHILVSVT